MLSGVVADATAPAIVRATALSMLTPGSTPELATLVTRAAADPDALVRRAAAEAAAGLDQATAAGIVGPLLDDDIRTVRLEAVRVLTHVGGALPSPEWRARFDRGADELRASLRFNADRAEARVTLGSFELALGRVGEAEAEYRAAVRMQPEFVPGHLSLADLLRATGRDAEAEAVLRTALARVPSEGQPALQHGLGLALIRLKRHPEAVAALRLAAEGAPEEARFVFVYGVALHDTGQAPAARRVLADAARRHPGDPSILDALVSYSLEAGDRAAARQWAERLATAMPGDADVARRLEDLRR